MTWAYHLVNLKRELGASSDEMKAAHTSYLRCVDYFLDCANRDSTKSDPPDNYLETARAYMQDFFRQLTFTLLQLFAEDQVRTNIESTYLDDVMRKLRDIDDPHMKEWIPDDLVPQILDLAEKLATANHYADDEWVDNIKGCARAFKANITRVKCKPDSTA